MIPNSLRRDKSAPRKWEDIVSNSQGGAYYTKKDRAHRIVNCRIGEAQQCDRSHFRTIRRGRLGTAVLKQRKGVHRKRFERCEEREQNTSPMSSPPPERKGEKKTQRPFHLDYNGVCIFGRPGVDGDGASGSA